MITFKTQELKDQTTQLLEFYNENSIYYEFYNFDDIDDQALEDEVIITDETTIEIGLPQCDESIEITLREALGMKTTIPCAEFTNNSRLITASRVLIRVGFMSPEILDQFEEDTFQQDFEYNGKKYKVDIVKNDFSFGMAVVLHGEYDDYLPPILYDDYFIDISAESGKITKPEIDSIYHAYAFEINATLNIDIRETSRPELYEPYDEEDDKGAIKLRQLILGEGTLELLKLFNSVSADTDPEIRVLYYSKVAEYVSQTIVKKELLETVLNKLNTKRALAPDAEYVLELERIFEEQRSYKKDNEALRLTIETCCDIFEIAEVSPDYLIKVKKINTESPKEDRTDALREFATAMSDTRNMIAHAKTNYTKKGKECPVNQLNEFANCCMVAAIQVIRWYSRQHESIKIK